MFATPQTRQLANLAAALLGTLLGTGMAVAQAFAQPAATWEQAERKQGPAAQAGFQAAISRADWGRSA
jgi:hypothetical protein